MCNSELKPHVHAQLIKAWAEGHTVQCWNERFEKWIDSEDPAWSPSARYRIKPEQSDFDKYGIEKGDVWKITPQSSYSFTVAFLSGFTFIDTKGTAREPDERMVLLFRRGVVDKL